MADEHLIVVLHQVWDGKMGWCVIYFCHGDIPSVKTQHVGLWCEDLVMLLVMLFLKNFLIVI